MFVAMDVLHAYLQHRFCETRPSDGIKRVVEVSSLSVDTRRSVSPSISLNPRRSPDSYGDSLTPLFPRCNRVGSPIVEEGFDIDLDDSHL